jgi:hypothetical protein
MNSIHLLAFAAFAWLVSRVISPSPHRTPPRTRRQQDGGGPVPVLVPPDVSLLATTAAPASAQSPNPETTPKPPYRVLRRSWCHSCGCHHLESIVYHGSRDMTDDERLAAALQAVQDMEADAARARRRTAPLHTGHAGP